MICAEIGLALALSGGAAALRCAGAGLTAPDTSLVS